MTVILDSPLYTSDNINLIFQYVKNDIPASFYYDMEVMRFRGEVFIKDGFVLDRFGGDLDPCHQFEKWDYFAYLMTDPTSPFTNAYYNFGYGVAPLPLRGEYIKVARFFGTEDDEQFAYIHENLNVQKIVRTQLLSLIELAIHNKETSEQLKQERDQRKLDKAIKFYLKDVEEPVQIDWM